MKLKAYDLSYFLGKNFFGDDGSQNMFVYQPTLRTLQLQEHKGTDYVTGWKSKGVYSYTPSLLYTAFLYSIKLFGYKISFRTKQLRNQNCKCLHCL